jgi:hypothetical protein
MPAPRRLVLRAAGNAGARRSSLRPRVSSSVRQQPHLFHHPRMLHWDVYRLTFGIGSHQAQLDGEVK